MFKTPWPYIGVAFLAIGLTWAFGPASIQIDIGAVAIATVAVVIAYSDSERARRRDEEHEEAMEAERARRQETESTAEVSARWAPHPNYFDGWRYLVIANNGPAIARDLRVYVRTPSTHTIHGLNHNAPGVDSFLDVNPAELPIPQLAPNGDYKIPLYHVPSDRTSRYQVDLGWVEDRGPRQTTYFLSAHA